MDELPDRAAPPDGGGDPALHAMELAVGWVLRIGVVVSVAIVLAGLTLVFVDHPSYARMHDGISYHAVTGLGTRYPHSLGDVAHTIATGSGEGLIMLGLMVLILTPVIRVAVGVAAFAVQRDLPMSLVTAAVLAILVASFFIGGA